MATEFVLQLRIASIAIASHRNIIRTKGNPAIRIVFWQNDAVRLGLEALWAMHIATKGICFPFSIECDAAARSLAVYAAENTPSQAQFSVAMHHFCQNISQLIAWATADWWIANSEVVLKLPLCSGTKIDRTCEVPLQLGRKIIMQHRKNHVLLLHRAPFNSKFDVFWRMLAQSYELPGEPLIWFGRVQYDVFFALVDFSVLPKFLRITHLL